MNVTAVRTYTLTWGEEEMATLYNILDYAKNTIIHLPDNMDLTKELGMIEDLQDLRYRKV
jgi:hypothetical protein